MSLAKTKIIVDLVVVSTNPIDKNMRQCQNGFIISHQFLRVKIQKNIWNHYLVEFLFLPFFSPLIQQSILETWKTASGNGFLCLIVIDSWLLCTLFATLKTYMKQWNFDPLEKNIKNEEVEEISFCHSSWCFQSYSSWSVATNSHSTENMFDLPLTQ